MSSTYDVPARSEWPDLSAADDPSPAAWKSANARPRPRRLLGQAAESSAGRRSRRSRRRALELLAGLGVVLEESHTVSTRTSMPSRASFLCGLHATACRRCLAVADQHVERAPRRRVGGGLGQGVADGVIRSAPPARPRPRPRVPTPRRVRIGTASCVSLHPGPGRRRRTGCSRAQAISVSTAPSPRRGTDSRAPSISVVPEALRSIEPETSRMTRSCRSPPRQEQGQRSSAHRTGAASTRVESAAARASTGRSRVTGSLFRREWQPKRPGRVVSRNR